MSAPIAIQWRPRLVPLAPAAAIAVGAASQDFARRLLRETDARLGALMAVAGDELLLVLGDAAALPWVDGVVYLGRDPAAPSLLLPTHQEPIVHAGLLEGALLRAAGAKNPPWAVLPSSSLLVPVGAARTLAREALTLWLAARKAA